MASILKVNELQHTGGTTAATIDSSGHILQPAKPMFHVTKSGADQAVTSSTATKINWATVVTDVGGHFSVADDEYTIPVSGMYNIQCCLRGSATANTMDYVIIYLYLNGAMIKTLGQLNIRDDDLNNSHVNGSVNIYLNAGNVISFYGSVSGGAAHFGADSRYTFCSGFLIG